MVVAIYIKRGSKDVLLSAYHTAQLSTGKFMLGCPGLELTIKFSTAQELTFFVGVRLYQVCVFSLTVIFMDTPLVQPRSYSPVGW